MVNNYERLKELLSGRDKVVINPDQPKDWGPGYIYTWVNHIQITQWENSITIFQTSKRWVSHIHTRKDVAVPSYDSVRICENGKLFFTIKGKKSYKLDVNAYVFASIAHSLNECFNDHIVEPLTINEIAIANNPRLADLAKYLPDHQVTNMFTLSSYIRSRIYKAYDQKGTGAAYKAILGINHKPLLAIAWSQPTIVQHLRRMLKEGVSADQLAHQLEKVHPWNLQACMTLTEIYPLAKAIKIFEKSKPSPAVHWVHDLVRIYKALQKMGVTVPLSFDVEYDHDLVSLEWSRRAREKKSQIQLPVYPELEHKEGEWSFDSPKLGAELLDAGVNLSICVGSYIEYVAAKVKKVIIIRKDGKDFACLEIVNDRLCQAKLYRNQRIATHPELLALVLAWAERLKLTLDTPDVTTAHCLLIEDVE